MDSRFHGNDGPGENQGRSVTPMTIGVHDKKSVWKTPRKSQRGCFFYRRNFYRIFFSIGFFIVDSRFHGNDGAGENQGRSVTPMTIGVHNKKPVWKPPVCQQRCFFIEGIFYRRRISIEGIFYSGFPFSREWRSWWKPGAIRHSDDNRSPRQKVCLKNPS